MFCFTQEAADPEEEEYQLALYPGGGTGYERHRDAMPDDGQTTMSDGATAVLQRRVTCLVYTCENCQCFVSLRRRAYLCWDLTCFTTPDSIKSTALG